MYNVWVPVMNREFDEDQRKKLIFQLNRFNPQTVLLVFWRVLWDEEAKQKEIELFLETKKFLEEAGFNVGIWLAPTIGYSAPFNPKDNNAPFQHLIRFDGSVIGDAYCPLDDSFVEDFCDLIKRLVATGVDKIMFEDDFTFSGGKTTAEKASCCCEKHLEKYSQIMGREVKREELCNLLYHQGPNVYRQKWFEMQGIILEEFCKKIELSAHSVNPNVRIGLSANSSSYMQEGITIDKLARVIAGETRPFIRLTGAPYWQNMPTFATCIDAIRVQTEWCKGGIELITEGDTYPRPRHWVPAAKLEAYDMILRADGKSHGILKYMLDYNSDADYETGYIDRHILNSEIYEEIEKRFTGDTVGLRIFEYPELLKSLEFNRDFPFSYYCTDVYLPLVSQFFAADNSLPTTYQNTGGATLVFGENANYIDEEILNGGVILDAAAAKILLKKGVDIGIESFEEAKVPAAEFFTELNDRVSCATPADAAFYKFTLKSSAEVSGEFVCLPPGLAVIPTYDSEDDFEHFPTCFTYENQKGQRFMVYSFSARTVTVDSKGWLCGVFRNYLRQKQLVKGIEWLQKGRPLPAMCMGNPELYILCKRDGEKLTVGIWNIFPDSILKPKIKLDGEYKSLDCFKCSGKIVGNTVYLDEPIAPYDFVCFTVEK